QRMSVKAHEALGCKGVSRSDIIVDEQGVCWLLETNTIPGMTPTSLLPDAARVAGMDFQALCRYLIELALEEHQGRMDAQARIRP
ncbi:MAG: D-alanine--D-alanine ligase, partial [Coriobacteriales bacterium]|nr:D-alanine--D-alanine ligase [Coriobacteriales bacterium]